MALCLEKGEIYLRFFTAGCLSGGTMKKFFSKGNRCLERQKEVRKLPKSLTNTPGVYMEHVIGRGIWLFELAFSVSV